MYFINCFHRRSDVLISWGNSCRRFFFSRFTVIPNPTFPADFLTGLALQPRGFFLTTLNIHTLNVHLTSPR